jgi:hypothetical protein
MLGSAVVDPQPNQAARRGDPSLSLPTAVEQYRTKYVFLAPDDYSESYVDMVAPIGAQVMLDGAAVTQAPVAVGGGSTFGVTRIPLSSGMAGAHVLTADQPVGIQVMGYGLQTSYQYPGGMDLKMIAPPPLPIL